MSDAAQSLIDFLKNMKDSDDYEFSWRLCGTWYSISDFEIYKKQFMIDLCDVKIRKKQKTTIVVNGFQVPAPETTCPQRGQIFYIPNILELELYNTHVWFSDNLRYLDMNIVHLTKEAAIKHAKALLGIDPNS